MSLAKRGGCGPRPRGVRPGWAARGSDEGGVVFKQGFQVGGSSMEADPGSGVAHRVEGRQLPGGDFAVCRPVAQQ